MKALTKKEVLIDLRNVQLKKYFELEVLIKIEEFSGHDKKKLFSQRNECETKIKIIDSIIEKLGTHNFYPIDTYIND